LRRHHGRFETRRILLACVVGLAATAGSKTTGDYTRHAFSYTVPAGDPGAGTVIWTDSAPEWACFDADVPWFARHVPVTG
jgi:phosphodiesterase/alkaline phosphatase D-like protein